MLTSCAPFFWCNAEPQEASGKAIPVPVVNEVEPPSPGRGAVCSRNQRKRNNASSADAEPPLAESLSVTDATGAELAVALGTWPERRPWDGLRHADMESMLHAQAGESVWRQPVLQAAAILRHSAGTPGPHDMHPFHDHGAQLCDPVLGGSSWIWSRKRFQMYGTSCALHMRHKMLHALLLACRFTTQIAI